MSRIYIPARSPEDWRQFLAEPEKQWKTGYSARTAAYSWQTAGGFPKEVSELLVSYGDENFRSLELLLALPEHKVSLPPKQSHPSQCDVYAVAKLQDGSLASIAVEAKVSEPFGPTVGSWFSRPSEGKKARLAFLINQLKLEGMAIDHIRYQLLHRMASAIIEAERFNARYAVLIIHSFSQSDERFQDFSSFLSLYGQKGEAGRLVHLFSTDNFQVLAGWARGDAKFLEL